MKSIYFVILFAMLNVCKMYSQISTTESINSLKSNTLNIETDYLNIAIKTWNKDYIEVKSDVIINLGREDDKHNLEIQNTTKGINILSTIDCDKIKKLIITTDKDGNKTIKPMDNWEENVTGNFSGSVNFGYEIDGLLTMFVPVNLQLNIKSIYGDVYINGVYQEIITHSTYGLIEAKLENVDQMKQVNFESTYDIVDLTLDKKSNARLNLHTSYGSIYTDLPFQIKNSVTNDNKHCGSHTTEKYFLNSGSVAFDITATYDNIYVRSYN